MQSPKKDMKNATSYQHKKKKLQQIFELRKKNLYKKRFDQIDLKRSLLYYFNSLSSCIAEKNMMSEMDYFFNKQNKEIPIEYLAEFFLESIYEIIPKWIYGESAKFFFRSFQSKTEKYLNIKKFCIDLNNAKIKLFKSKNIPFCTGFEAESESKLDAFLDLFQFKDYQKFFESEGKEIAKYVFCNHVQLGTEEKVCISCKFFCSHFGLKNIGENKNQKEEISETNLNSKEHIELNESNSKTTKNNQTSEERRIKELKVNEKHISVFEASNIKLGNDFVTLQIESNQILKIQETRGLLGGNFTCKNCSSSCRLKTPRNSNLMPKIVAQYIFDNSMKKCLLESIPKCTENNFGNIFKNLRDKFQEEFNFDDPTELLSLFKEHIQDYFHRFHGIYPTCKNFYGKMGKTDIRGAQQKKSDCWLKLKHRAIISFLKNDNIELPKEISEKDIADYLFPQIQEKKMFNFNISEMETEKSTENSDLKENRVTETKKEIEPEKYLRDSYFQIYKKYKMIQSEKNGEHQTDIKRIETDLKEDFKKIQQIENFSNQIYLNIRKMKNVLVNLGNTCYINSFVQCIANIEPLKIFLLIINSTIVILYLLLLKNSNFKFSNDQNDVSEFISFLFEKTIFFKRDYKIVTKQNIEEEKKNFIEEKKRFFGDFFVENFLTFVESLVSCTCGRSHTYLECDIIYNYDLEISDNIIIDYFEYQKCPTNQTNFIYGSVYIKIFFFPTFPMILLNRNNMGKKTNGVVRIDKELQIVGNSYQIVATINHNGASTERGHFTTFIKNDSNKWNKFDDVQTEELKDFPEDQLSSTYILILRKKEILLPKYSLVFLDSQKPKLKGIPNFEQNCFLNSAIQIFRHIYTHSEMMRSSIDRKENTLIKNSLFNPSKDSSNQLLASIKFKSGVQQDFAEFFEFILSNLNCEYLIFNKLQRCVGCNFMKETKEQFITLQLPIPQYKYNFINLEKCFSNFISEEYENCNCDKCESVLRKKHLTPLCLPGYLFIQLKRTAFNNKGEKIETNVIIPRLMKLGETDYELTCVVLHSGDAIGGHYVVQLKYFGDWFHCNDSLTTLIDSPDLFSSDVYYVVYSKKSDRVINPEIFKNFFEQNRAPCIGKDDPNKVVGIQSSLLEKKQNNSSIDSNTLTSPYLLNSNIDPRNVFKRSELVISEKDLILQTALLYKFDVQRFYLSNFLKTKSNEIQKKYYFNILKWFDYSCAIDFLPVFCEFNFREIIEGTQERAISKTIKKFFDHFEKEDYLSNLNHLKQEILNVLNISHVIKYGNNTSGENVLVQFIEHFNDYFVKGFHLIHSNHKVGINTNNVIRLVDSKIVIQKHNRFICLEKQMLHQINRWEEKIKITEKSGKEEEYQLIFLLSFDDRSKHYLTYFKVGRNCFSYDGMRDGCHILPTFCDIGKCEGFTAIYQNSCYNPQNSSKLFEKLKNLKITKIPYFNPLEIKYPIAEQFDSSYILELKIPLSLESGKLQLNQNQIEIYQNEENKKIEKMLTSFQQYIFENPTKLSQVCIVAIMKKIFTEDKKLEKISICYEINDTRKNLESNFFIYPILLDERSILLFCDCSVYPFKLYVFDNTMKPFKIFLGNITNFLEPVWKIKFPKKELRCEIIQINLQNDSTNNPLLTIFYSFLFHSNLPHFFSIANFLPEFDHSLLINIIKQDISDVIMGKSTGMFNSFIKFSEIFSNWKPSKIEHNKQSETKNLSQLENESDDQGDNDLGAGETTQYDEEPICNNNISDLDLSDYECPFGKLNIVVDGNTFVQNNWIVYHNNIFTEDSENNRPFRSENDLSMEDVAFQMSNGKPHKFMKKFEIKFTNFHKVFVFSQNKNEKKLLKTNANTTTFISPLFYILISYQYLKHGKKCIAFSTKYFLDYMNRINFFDEPISSLDIVDNLVSKKKNSNREFSFLQGIKKSRSENYPPSRFPTVVSSFFSDLNLYLNDKNLDSVRDFVYCFLKNPHFLQTVKELTPKILFKHLIPLETLIFDWIQKSYLSDKNYQELEKILNGMYGFNVLPKFSQIRNYRNSLFNKVVEFVSFENIVVQKKVQKLIQEEEIEEVREINKNAVIGVKANFERIIMIGALNHYLQFGFSNTEQLYLKIMVDATHFSNLEKTIAAITLIDNNFDDFFQTCRQIFPFSIISGAEKNLDQVLEETFKDKYSLQVDDEQIDLLTIIASDWKAYKNLLKFMGVCPWCDLKFQPTCVGDQHEKCTYKCQNGFSKVGHFLHYLFAKTKLKNLDRKQVILEILHATLRSSELVINSIIAYAIEFGCKREELECWIKECIGQNLRLKQKKNKTGEQSNAFKLVGGNEDHRLSFLLSFEQFTKIFFKDLDQFFIEKLTKIAWHRNLAKRLAFWQGQLVSHKSTDGEVIKSIENTYQFSKCVNFMINEILDEILDYNTKDNFISSFLKISEATLVIIYFGRYDFQTQVKKKEEHNEEIIEDIFAEEEDEEYLKHLNEYQKEIDTQKKCEEDDMRDEGNDGDNQQKKREREKEEEEKSSGKKQKKPSVKERLKQKVFEIWEKIGANLLTKEEQRDFFHLYMQNWILLLIFVFSKFKGYYPHFLAAHLIAFLKLYGPLVRFATIGFERLHSFLKQYYFKKTPRKNPYNKFSAEEIEEKNVQYTSDKAVLVYHIINSLTQKYIEIAKHIGEKSDQYNNNKERYDKIYSFFKEQVFNQTNNTDLLTQIQNFGIKISRVSLETTENIAHSENIEDQENDWNGSEEHTQAQLEEVGLEKEEEKNWINLSTFQIFDSFLDGKNGEYDFSQLKFDTTSLRKFNQIKKIIYLQLSQDIFQTNSNTEPSSFDHFQPVSQSSQNKSSSQKKNTEPSSFDHFQPVSQSSQNKSSSQKKKNEIFVRSEPISFQSFCLSKNINIPQRKNVSLYFVLRSQIELLTPLRENSYLNTDLFFPMNISATETTNSILQSISLLTSGSENFDQNLLKEINIPQGCQNFSQLFKPNCCRKIINIYENNCLVFSNNQHPNPTPDFEKELFLSFKMVGEVLLFFPLFYLLDNDDNSLLIPQKKENWKKKIIN